MTGYELSNVETTVLAGKVTVDAGIVDAGAVVTIVDAGWVVTTVEY